jgi:hypothetical protein
MEIRILEIAQLEFNEAKEFYEIEQTGLGAKFENEIKNGLLRIQKFPQAWHPITKKLDGISPVNFLTKHFARQGCPKSFALRAPVSCLRIKSCAFWQEI